MKILLHSRKSCLIGSLLLLAAALSSCAEVKSNKVVGTNVPANLRAFEGKWNLDLGADKPILDSDAVMIKIKDASAGLLEFSPVIPKKDAPPGNSLCYVRILEKRTFVSLSQEKGGYNFALLTSVGSRSIVVAWPNVAVLARLVDSGVLRGKVEYNAEHKPSSVTLEGLTETECTRLFSGEFGNCFEWEHPLVLVRPPNS